LDPINDRLSKITIEEFPVAAIYRARESPSATDFLSNLRSARPVESLRVSEAQFNGASTVESTFGGSLREIK
jgi:hypothetical protein